MGPGVWFCARGSLFGVGVWWSGDLGGCCVYVVFCLVPGHLSLWYRVDSCYDVCPWTVFFDGFDGHQSLSGASSVLGHHHHDFFPVLVLALAPGLSSASV